MTEFYLFDLNVRTTQGRRHGMTEFSPLYLNVRTAVGLTTVSRKNLNKKTGCRDQGTRMTPYALQKFDPCNNSRHDVVQSPMQE